MELDANDLLLYARVADAGSFSAAAQRLGLPKSTVSRRIAALEQRLGERLLQRSTRRLSITEFGQGVLAHARALTGEVEAAQALAQHRQAQPSGRLRVSMPADFAAVVLPRMLARFVQDHPRVQLELDLSPRRVDLVAENVDLAVRAGALLEDSLLAARLLLRMRMALFAAPAYLAAHGQPGEPDALLALHALMLAARDGEARPWVLHRDDAAESTPWRGWPSSRTVANSPDLLVRLALEGAGVVAAPQAYAQAALATGDLVAVLPQWSLPPSPVWAVFPGRRLMPARTRAFLEALVQACGSCQP